MTKEEIYASKELSISEKQLFMWLNDYLHDHEEINLKYTDIAKLIASDQRNTFKRLKSLVEKGFISKTRNKVGTCNTYKILR